MDTQTVKDYMTTLQKTIYNVATGETITRDYNETELADHETDKAKTEKDAKAKTKTDADKTATRKAVLDKLGLTANEIAALLG